MTKCWAVRSLIRTDGIATGELWCYTADRVHDQDADNIETACGWVVVLPRGLAVRKATCPECLELLA